MIKKGFGDKKHPKSQMQNHIIEKYDAYCPCDKL